MDIRFDESMWIGLTVEYVTKLLFDDETRTTILALDRLYFRETVPLRRVHLEGLGNPKRPTINGGIVFWPDVRARPLVLRATP